VSEHYSDIVRDILAYLAEHPDAGDSVEGIAEWWLLRQTIRRRTVDVAAALADLVARGLVVERTRAGARTHYRINTSRRVDIARLIRAEGSPKEAMMTVTIANVSRQLVVVPLNSGETVHLAPKEVSSPIDDLEVQHNAGVDKLVREHFIRVSSDEDDADKPADSKRRTAKSR